MPVAMTAAGVTYYLGFDQVGSLRLVADAAGIVVKSITYDSFGNIIDDTNPVFDVPFGFAGGLHDRDTGLVRFGYRDYNPDVGRWTAKDPIGFAGGDTDLYGYVLNDPINAVDPDGLRHWGRTVTGYVAKAAGIGAIVIGSFEVAKGSILIASSIVLPDMSLGILAGIFEIGSGAGMILAGGYLYYIGDMILNEEKEQPIDDQNACP